VSSDKQMNKMLEIWESQDDRALAVFSLDPMSKAVTLASEVHYKFKKTAYSLWTRLHELYHVWEVFKEGVVKWYSKYSIKGFFLLILEKLGFIKSAWDSHEDEHQANAYADAMMRLRVTYEHYLKTDDEFLQFACAERGIELIL